MHYPEVVRVFATTMRPDYESPWQTHAAQNSTGSGVSVGKRLIVTGAHVVADATFLQVQKTSDPNKVLARVVAMGHDCDLALLTVDDDAFWADLPAAELDDLPALREQVAVVGFPTGGEELSITEGVVSRIEVQRYSHSQRYLLAITVDAAINAGNSGGPVFRGEKVCGIAFQTLVDAENVGELVPTVFIRRLLEAAERGVNLDVPGLGIAAQNLENPVMRGSLGLPAGVSGILVGAIAFGSSAWGVLKARDVLLSIDGHTVANNQTVRYMDRLRTHFAVVLAEHHVGDVMPLVVWRDGAAVELEVTLTPHVHLVAANRYDIRPSWFLYGGLVFQPLSRDYLETWQKWWGHAPRRMVDAYFNGERTSEQREVVIISQILADAVNVGYTGFFNQRVGTVNGVVPRDLADLVTQLDAAEGLVEIETDIGQLIVFDADEVRASLPLVQSRYRILLDRSDDLIGVTPVA
jgi:S1-C subfamily serine protease